MNFYGLVIQKTRDIVMVYCSTMSGKVGSESLEI